MKVSDLFESKPILLEGVSFRGIQNVIYEFVLNRMKLDPSILEDAKNLVHSSDQFWVDEFDAVLSAFERAKDIYIIQDALCDAVVAVSESVVDYYGNTMNHPPGYKAKKLTVINCEGIKDKELHTMIEKIDSGYMKKLRAEEESAKLHAKTVRAEQIKSITPERLEQVAAFVKKYDAKGWKLFYKQIQKPNIKLPDYFNLKDTPESKIKAVKTPSDLKDLFKNLEPKKYIAGILDNFWNLDELEEKDEFHGLRIISDNNALCVKLAKLLD